MIHIIKSKDRHFSDMGWLKTYWLFSFDSYHDPANVSHGMLRVFNDDIVAAQTGFDTHPHEEMEIVTIILDGEMTHKDTMGNETAIRKNDVQRMTAGTGLFHSEKNHGDKAVHFYQIWIKPDKNHLEPSYDQKTYHPELWQNRMALLASDKTPENIVKLNTDASVYRAQLDEGKTVEYHLEYNRKPFVYLTDGQIEINGEKLQKNDQARISDEDALSITAIQRSDFILIDVPA